MRKTLLLEATPAQAGLGVLEELREGRPARVSPGCSELEAVGILEEKVLPRTRRSGSAQNSAPPRTTTHNTQLNTQNTGLSGKAFMTLIWNQFGLRKELEPSSADGGTRPTKLDFHKLVNFISSYKRTQLVPGHFVTTVFPSVVCLSVMMSYSR